MEELQSGAAQAALDIKTINDSIGSTYPDQAKILIDAVMADFLPETVPTDGSGSSDSSGDSSDPYGSDQPDDGGDSSTPDSSTPDSSTPASSPDGSATPDASVPASTPDSSTPDASTTPDTSSNSFRYRK